MSDYENRVVGLKFDNAQFERRARQTLKTLDSMSRKIYMLGSRSVTSSFNAVENAASKVTLNPMQNSLAKVTAAFETLKTRAIASIESITSSAASAASSWAKSLSIDQFISGWTKYEEKTAAIQTMLSAGYDLDKINANLEKLMWYTDETSYNFTDMANNIGKFTAQGVDLDVATNAMMGISNWAASAGQNASSASMAMYNLSQAIGMGKVTLMDWKSVENANMSTKEFKEQVLETAVSLGTLKKAEDGTITTLKGAEVTYKNFRDYLSEGFFTTEVLTTTLEKYNEYTNKVYEAVNGEAAAFDTAAEAMKYFDEEAAAAGIASATLGEKAFKAAQEAKSLSDAILATQDAVSSTWMRIIERVTGTYYDTKGLWTDFTSFLWDVFAGPLDEIDSYLENWLGTNQFDEFGEKLLDADGNELTERNRLMDTLLTTMSGLSEAFSVIQKGFKEVFPAPTMEKLIEVVQGFKDWAESLVYLEEPIVEGSKRITKYTEKGKKLLNTAKSIFSVFKNIGTMIKKLAEIASPFFKSVKKLASSITDIFLLYNKLKSLEIGLPKWMDKIKDKLVEIVSITSKYIDSLRVSLVPMLNLISEGGFKGFLVSVASILNGLIGTVLDIFMVLTGIKTEIYKSDVKNWIITIAAVIYNVANILKQFVKPIIEFLLTALTFIVNKFQLVNKWFVKALELMGPSIINIIQTIINSLSKIFKEIEVWMPSLIRGLSKVVKALEPIIVFGINLLTEGLLKILRWLPRIFGYISNGITYLKNFFKDFSLVDWFSKQKEKLLGFVDTYFGIGKETITGFMEGITETIKKSKPYEWVTNLITKIKDILQIHSPSLVMFGIGAFLVLGFFKGAFEEYSNLKDALVEAFGSIVKAIADKFPALLDLFSGVLQPVVQILKAIGRLVDALDFVKVLGLISSAASTVLSIIKFLAVAFGQLVTAAVNNGTFEKFILLLNDLIDSIINSGILSSVFQTLASGLNTIKSILDLIVTPLADILNEISSSQTISFFDSFTNFINTIGGYGKQIIEAFINMISDDKKLLNFAKTIFVLASAFDIFATSILKLKIAGTVRIIGKLGSTMQELFDGVKTKSANKWYTKILLFVGVLGFLASQIAKMDLPSIIAFFSGLVVAFVAMSVAVKILSKIKMDPATATGLSTVLGTLSWAIVAIGAAASMLAKYSMSQVITSMASLMIALTSLEVVIAGLVAIGNIKGFDSVKMKSLIGDMATLGLIMFEIAGVTAATVLVAKLAGTVSSDGYKKMFATLGALLLGLIAVGALSEVAKKMNLESDIATLTRVLLAFTGSLAALAVTAVILDHVSMSALGKLGILFAGLSIALGGLVALNYWLKAMKEIRIDDIERLTTIMFGITTMLAALSVVSLLLNFVKIESIGKLGLILVELMVSIAALTGLVKLMNMANIDSVDTTKLAILLTALSGVVTTFAAVALGLGLVSWESIGKLGALLTGLEVSFAGLIVVCKLIKSGEGISAIDVGYIAVLLGGLATVTAMFAGVAFALGMVAWESIGKLGALLTGLELSFAGLIAVCNLIKNGKGISIIDIQSVSMLLLSLAGVVAVLAAVAFGLRMVSWESLGKVAALYVFVSSIIPLLVLCSNAVKDVSSVTSLKTFSTLLLSFAGVMAIMGLLATWLDSISWESLAKTGAVYFAVLGIVPLLALSSTIIKQTGNIKALKTLQSVLLSFVAVVAALTLFSVVMTWISWESLSKMGTVFAIVASTFVGIAAVTKLVNPTTLLSSLIPITAVLTHMLALVVAMAFVAKALGEGVSWNTLEQLGAIIAVLGGAMVGMVFLSKIVDRVKWESIGKMATILVALVGVFASVSAVLAGVMLVLNKISLSWATILQMGTMVVILAAAVAGMVLLSKNADKVKWESIGKMAVMLATLIGTLAAVSGVMTILSSALSKFASIQWETIGKAAVVMVGLVVVLVAMGIAGKIIGTGLIVLSAGLVILAAGLLIISIAAITLATAVALLASTLVPFMDSVNAVLPTFNENMKGLAEGLGNAFVAFVEVISQNMNAFKDLIANALLAVWNGLVDFFKGITDRKDDVSAIFEGLSQMLSSLINNLLAVAKETLPTFVDLVVSLVGTLLAKIEEYNILGKINNLFTQALELFNTNLPLIETTLSNLITSLLTVISNTSPTLAATVIQLIKDSLAELVKEDNLKDITKSLVEAVVQIIEGLAEKAGDLVGALGDLIIAICDKLAEEVEPVIKSVTDLVVAILDAAGDSLTEINTALVTFIKKVLTSVATTLGDLTDALVTFIAQVIEQAASGLITGIQTITDAFNKLATSIVYALGYVIGNSGKLGGEIIKAFFQGVTDGISGGSKIIKSLLNDIIEGVKYIFDIHSPSEKLWDVGKNVVLGFSNGIKDNSQSAVDAINDMCGRTDAAANTAYEINSPSRLFYRKGYYTVSGFVEGVEDNAYLAENAMVDLADTSIESFNDTMGIHSNSDEGIDSGGHYVGGYVEGVDENAYKAEDVSADLANGAIDAANNVIDSDAEETGENLVDEICSGATNSEAEKVEKKTALSVLNNVLDSIKEFLGSGKISGALSNFKSYLSSSGNSTNSKSITELLCDFFGLDMDDLTLMVSGIFDTTEIEEKLAQLKEDAENDSNANEGSTTSKRIRSSVLAASTSNAITRNVEAYAAQRDTEAATIQKILENMTSPTGYQNTFYITNEDPETTANLVADKLKNQVQSEAMAWA